MLKTKGMRDDGDDCYTSWNRLETYWVAYKLVPCWLASRPLRHNDITRAEDLGLALIGPDELERSENTPNGMVYRSRW
ncbi:DUF1887 family CARF protein [Vibrio lentus]|nr:DUF1887 family CARF protein [Vibrio lentus]